MCVRCTYARKYIICFAYNGLFSHLKIFFFVSRILLCARTHICTSTNTRSILNVLYIYQKKRPHASVLNELYTRRNSLAVFIRYSIVFVYNFRFKKHLINAHFYSNSINNFVFCFVCLRMNRHLFMCLASLTWLNIFFFLCHSLFLAFMSRS